MQFFAFSSGLFDLMGSVETTSTAAPPTFPLFSASDKASSSISPPREELTSKTPSFIIDIVSLFMILFVSSVSGAWRDITSESLNKSSLDTCFQPSSSVYSSSFRPETITFMPKAFAISAVLFPILPKPRMPIVFPESSTNG